MEISRSIQTRRVNSWVIELEPAEYRARFVCAVAHLGLDPDGARRLVEAVSGRPFQDCGRAELEPLLLHLRGIAWQLASERRPACPA